MVRKSKQKTAGKTPDIRTVAALAKVSIATVSRTINGSPVVSDRLSKRVWAAIEQLKYFPNTHARSLVSGRSRILGIIVENITNPFFPELIQSFEEIAVAHGYEILVSSSNSDPVVLTNCVRRMLERKVEGVAVLTFGEEEPVLDQLVHHDIPMVLNASPGTNVDLAIAPDTTSASTAINQFVTDYNAAIKDLNSHQPPGRARPQQDRLSRRSPQAALGHHPRKRLPRCHGSRRPRHSKEVGHRV